MIEIPVADAPDQTFAVVINNRRCSFRLRYNQSTNRWSFDLSLDDVPVLHGHRIVTDRDLFEGLGLGLGSLYASSGGADVEPGRQELPSGVVRLFHATEADIAALGA